MPSNKFLFALNTKNVVPSSNKERKLQPVHDNSEKTMNGNEQAFRAYANRGPTHT